MMARNQIRNTLADFTVLRQYCQKQSPEVLLKMLFLKSSQYPQQTPALGLLFKNVAGLKACNVIKKRLRRRCFIVNIAKFLILTFSKNICERLLFGSFNGSLLHGPKCSRSRFYDRVRLQGLSHRSSFLFLNWHEPSSSHRLAFKNLRRIPLISVIFGRFRWFQVVLERFSSFLSSVSTNS